MNSKEIIISPSILSANFANLGKELKKIEKSSAKWVHLDIMDGHFVPNITFGAGLIKSIRKISNLFFDAHLMIENPENYILDFIKAGCDGITIHYEATFDKTFNLLNEIKENNIIAGLSIKPNTNVIEIEKFLPYLDLVLVMTVEPGFGGQKFMEFASDKLYYICEKNVKYISVDGGIDDKTSKICIKKGANVLVSGNYLFSSDNFNQNVALLQN